MTPLWAVRRTANTTRREPWFWGKALGDTQPADLARKRFCPVIAGAEESGVVAAARLSSPKSALQNIPIDERLVGVGVNKSV